MVNVLRSYSFDEAQMRRSMQHYENTATPTAENCNQMAMHLQGLRQQDEVQEKIAGQQREEYREISRTLQQQQANQPKTTVCNKVGSQTLCTTN